MRERTGMAGALSVAAAAVVMLLLIYRDTVLSMTQVWRSSDTYAHGWVIVPIALWLVWRRRRELLRTTARPGVAGLVLMAFAAMGWMIAHAIDLAVGEHLAIVAMSVALVAAVVGNRAARVIAFPLLFVFFAVPFGEELVPALMDFTAAFAVGLLELTGIPVYREGLFFSLPSGDFEVAKACSGIRYLIASVALGTLYAYLVYHRTWKRLVFFVLAIVVPVIANGLRAYLIVVLAHYSEMRIAVGVDHLIYGWLFFGIVMFVLFAIGSRFADDERPVRHSLSSGPRAAPVWALALTGLVALAIGFLGPAGAARISAAATAAPMSGLPVAAAGWEGPVSAPLDYQPDYSDASAVFDGVYRRAGQAVHVFVRFYDGGTPGVELVNERNRVYSEPWVALQHDVVPTSARPAWVNQSRLRAGRRRLVLWHWFEAGGDAHTSGASIKWERLRALLGRAPASSALVVLAAPSPGEDDEQTRALFTAFLAAHGASLGDCVATRAAPSSCVAP